MKTFTKSNALFTEAQRYIPGGVNSPVRAFKAVGGAPLYFKSGKGAYLTDADDQHYIDYVGSWGPLILGHCHPDVVAAVQQQAALGLSFGAPCALEITLAEKICQLMPHLEQIRMMNSGTEATMTAIRLARAVTGRDKIIKFTGCYHGHSDSLLIKAGSGLLTLGIPSSPGVPQALAAHTLTATFNDLTSVEQLFSQWGNEIAAIIVEPIAGNMNCIAATPAFLNGLRQLCDHHGSVLIFDEVMTGFRVARGGAHELYGITADLTTLGKIIGGGLPVGAVGGRKAMMQQLAPQGPVYQAGTLSGNPLAMAAGIATLNALCKPHVYEQLTATTQQLMHGLSARAKQAQIPFLTHAIGGMFGFFFTSLADITTYEETQQCNEMQFKQFFHAMLQHGIYFAPSAFEAGFVSIQHGAAEIAQTLAAAEEVFIQLKA